jgi:ClpP class serine protease
MHGTRLAAATTSTALSRNMFMVCFTAVAAAVAPANKILAQPGTITGSIGVLAARIGIKEALGEYGVTSDTVQLGDNASWASGFHTLTPQQKQMVSRECRRCSSSFEMLSNKQSVLMCKPACDGAAGRVQVPTSKMGETSMALV